VFASSPRSRERVCRVCGRPPTLISVGARGRIRSRCAPAQSHATPTQTGIHLRTLSGRPRPRLARFQSALCFSPAPRDDRAYRPVPRESSRPSVSPSGSVQCRTRSLRNSVASFTPGVAAWLNRPKPMRSFHARFGPHSPGHADTSFFAGASLLSLAAPPAGPPLRGQGTFGSPLKGILPTAPSSRPAPPPWGERAIPLAALRSTLRDGADCRHPSGAADLTGRLGLGSAWRGPPRGALVGALQNKESYEYD
jgi:hypothetical protein